MILFVGDYIRPAGAVEYTEVIDIVDSMTVLCSNGNEYTADEQSIDNALSANEYNGGIR